MDLQDQRLLAKLSAGDMVAQEAKYHAPCLASLYNKATALQVQADDDDDTNVSHGIALAELLSYTNDARLDDKKKTVFKLADLAKLYSARLKQTENNARIHSTRLKNRILSQIPDLSEHKEGRDVLLAFREDIGPALYKLCEDNYDDEAICLAKAAKVVRRDVFEMQAAFTGSFHQDCQQKADFFRHENQACPPSLSQDGKLRMGTKSDLLGCLEGFCATLRPDTPDSNVTIIDGAALVNILKPIAAKTFTEYALNVVCPYIRSQHQHADRVDMSGTSIRRTV